MSEIKIVIGQLLLQSALLKQVVDGSALAQVGLGDFNHRFGIIGLRGDKVVIRFQLLFAGAHKVNSRLRLPLALLISIFQQMVKKIFSIDKSIILIAPQSSEVLCLYSHRSSIRQLPHRGPPLPAGPAIVVEQTARLLWT